jgi:hypothetical protein
VAGRVYEHVAWFIAISGLKLLRRRRGIGQLQVVQ